MRRRRREEGEGKGTWRIRRCFCRRASVLLHPLARLLHRLRLPFTAALFIFFVPLFCSVHLPQLSFSFFFFTFVFNFCGVQLFLLFCAMICVFTLQLHSALVNLRAVMYWSFGAFFMFILHRVHDIMPRSLFNILPYCLFLLGP